MKDSILFTFLFAVPYKIYESQFWQLVCKVILIRLILFYNLIKEEVKKQFWFWYYESTRFFS